MLPLTALGAVLAIGNVRLLTLFLSPEAVVRGLGVAMTWVRPVLITVAALLAAGGVGNLRLSSGGHIGACGIFSARHPMLSVECVTAVTSMTPLAHRPLTTLSGGERQRAWIAMALAQTPAALQLDESTTHLDGRHQWEVMELLEGLNRQQRVIILMTLHDLQHTAWFSQWLVSDGYYASCWEDGSSRTVAAEPTVSPDEGSVMGLERRFGPSMLGNREVSGRGGTER